MEFKIKYFNTIQKSSISMKFIFDFYKTPLCIAVERQNIKIIDILLNHSKIDVNLKDEIFNIIYKIPSIIHGTK